MAERSAVNRNVVGSSPTPAASGPEEAAVRQAPSVSYDELRRWEDNGATWRLLSAEGDTVVIELCTCYGEPVDVVQGAPDLVEGFRSGQLGPRSDSSS